MKRALVGLSLLLLPSLASAEIRSVGVKSANFREAPAADAPILFSADKLYPVEVLKEDRFGWTQVKDFEGDVAWVASHLLSNEPTIVIKADRANVRASGSTSADLRFTAERGEVFALKQRKGDWLEIEDVNGEGGWIREDLIWGDAQAQKGEPKPEKKKAEQKDASPKDAGAKDAGAKPKPEKEADKAASPDGAAKAKDGAAAPTKKKD